LGGTTAVFPFLQALQSVAEIPLALSLPPDSPAIPPITSPIPLASINREWIIFQSRQLEREFHSDPPYFGEQLD
jgi:hypothetical protein